MENELVFLDELVALIKEKKELSTLDDSFVVHVLRSFLLPKQIAQLNTYESFKQCKRSTICKQLVSDVRKHLREVYGLFIKQSLPDIWNKFIKKGKPFDQIALQILQSHQSSFERFSYYQTVYELIFDKLKDVGLPESFVLADFACGCNPFAYDFLPVKPKKYVACDLSSADMVVINNYFSKLKIDGEALAFDLLSEDFSTWVSKQSFDVVFLFKALDSLEAVARHASKPFLASLPANFLVVSFALRSIGGKNTIGTNRRAWFENFCTKQGWSFQTLQIPNELFYVVKT